MSRYHLVRDGNTYHFSNTIDRHDKLPAGVYLVKFNQLTGYYFETGPCFEPPKKVYGNPYKLVTRFLKTYENRSQNTGILLTGEKGSGKTLTAKLLSLEAEKLGMPTIIINEPHCGDAFNSFIQKIDQPCILIFDEFEKVYEYQQQTMLLTLLDGVYPSKKMFVFTCNDSNNLERHLTNRPGRVWYSVSYGKLDEDFVREYCEDTLENKEYIEPICKLCNLFNKFNFDMLAALVLEINLYEETPTEAIKLLNINLDQNNCNYKVTIKVKGKELPSGEFYPNQIQGHPLTKASMYFTRYGQEKSDGEFEEDVQMLFEPTDVKGVDTQKDVYTYQNDFGTLTLTRVDEYRFSLDHPYAQGLIY